MKNEINWCYRETDKMTANFDIFHMDIDYTGNQTKRQKKIIAVSSLWTAVILPIEWFFENNGKLKEKQSYRFSLLVNHVVSVSHGTEASRVSVSFVGCYALWDRKWAPSL